MNLQRKIKDSNSVVKMVFLMAVFVMILIVTGKDKIDYFMSLNISVYNLYGWLSVIAVMIIIWKRKLKIDQITVLLFVRLILYIIPLIYIQDVEKYWGNYFTEIVSFCAYLIASQNHFKCIDKILNHLSTIFVILICLQVIYVFANLYKTYGFMNTDVFKVHMVIPVGASNYIACIILPFLFFVYYSETHIKIKYITIAICLAALLMIQSKNAVSVFVIFIAIKCSSSFIKYMIYKVKENYDIKHSIMTVIIIFVFIILSLSILIIKYILSQWYMGMTIDTPSVYDFVNAITSNRLNVYTTELTRWTQHLLFGNGVSYAVGYARSHNWIIELLAQSGVIGLMTFISALVIWYKNISRYIKSSPIIKSIFYFCVIVLLQGLGEISLFTITIDFLFWSMIGISISQANFIRGNETIDLNQKIKSIYVKY